MRRLCARRDGGQAIIFATVVGEAQRARYGYAVVFSTEYSPAPNGMPVSTELSRLRKIEDGLIRALQPMRAIHAGHVYAAGTMKVFFYAETALGAPVTVKTGPLSKASFTPKTHHDPTWELYARSLTPTEEEREDLINRKLIDTLEANGDIISEERVVDFSAWFPTEQEGPTFWPKLPPRATLSALT